MDEQSLTETNATTTDRRAARRLALARELREIRQERAARKERKAAKKATKGAPGAPSSPAGGNGPASATPEAAPATPATIVLAKGLRKAYKTNAHDVPVLQGVDLTIQRGEFVAIMGSSGCGKTTLLNCLSGLDDLDEGSVQIDGATLSELSDRHRSRHRARRMGFVFQSFNLIPVLSALQNVEMPLLLLGENRTKAREKALAALAAVGLRDRAHHKPSELSGGQQQRVALARALVNEPAIVWADEPTGNLDGENTRQVLDLLRDLNRNRGVTLVVVTHDAEVAAVANRIIRMEDGRITGDAAPVPLLRARGATA